MLLPMISSVTALAFTASICETMAEAEDGFISRRRDAAVSISSVLKILAALCGFMLAYILTRAAIFSFSFSLYSPMSFFSLLSYSRSWASFFSISSSATFS